MVLFGGSTPTALPFLRWRIGYSISSGREYDATTRSTAPKQPYRRMLMPTNFIMLFFQPFGNFCNRLNNKSSKQ